MPGAVLRFAIILLAYGAASLAAGYAVYVALLIVPQGGSGQDAQAGGITFGLMVTMFVAIFAGPLASLVVAWGEFRLWRMWWYYAVAGSLIGCALGTLFAPPFWFPWLGLGFGPVSGLLYWGIAGRNAGLDEKNPRYAVALVLFVFSIISLILTWSAFFGSFF
jgi:hypothetical protein